MWLATRHETAGVWNQAGGSFATEYGGLWDDEESGDDGGDGNDGDTRRNELVFIGLGIDEKALSEELQRCLLTEDEMAGGPEEWETRLSDPFPPWE